MMELPRCIKTGRPPGCVSRRSSIASSSSSRSSTPTPTSRSRPTAALSEGVFLAWNHLLQLAATTSSETDEAKGKLHDRGGFGDRRDRYPIEKQETGVIAEVECQDLRGCRRL